MGLLDRIKSLFIGNKYCAPKYLFVIALVMGITLALGSVFGYIIYRYDRIYRLEKQYGIYNATGKMTDTDMIFKVTFSKYQRKSLITLIVNASIFALTVLLAIIYNRKC